MFGKVVAAAIVGTLVAFPAACQEMTPDAALRLNQQGRWAEAANMAEALLAREGFSPQQRCELRNHRAYAYKHTSRVPQAVAEARGILADCATVLSAGHWIIREAEALLPRSAPPAVRSDDGWVAGDVAALGLDATALADHQRLCEASGADACLVAVRGSIVQEWYGPGYREPMNTMSSVKSWTALLAGLLIADGRLGVDDPVSRWIPEWRAGSEAGVTVRQLLTMTSGLPSSPELAARGQSVGRVSDKNAYAVGLDLTAPPGARFAYSNEGVQLLSPILERAAGGPLEDFAAERLFRPLRMLDTSLRVYPERVVWTYADANTTLRDFAKICELARGNGAWNGTQVVDAAWMRTVTTPIPQSARYGMLWWLDAPGVVATHGFRDTNCYAFLNEGVVVARMQNLDNPATTQYSLATLQNIVRRLVSR
jgi:CubicO group peptidase (beta-lactamase class C family)